VPSFSPDTSCIVAAMCAWHEHHERARAEIDRRLRQAQTMVVAGPALIEAYAVMTRLPPPHRLAPGDALALLEANFIGPSRIVVLSSAAYRNLLRRAPADGIAGGRTYDAVIAACVLRTRGTALLTFNEHHFAPFVNAGLDVVVPA
jgi:predicted nucleic acid-binding protein